MRMLAVLLVLIMIFPVPALAQESTGVCEMTITTTNTFYNKAGSTNNCSGQVSGYYIDEQFYISGQYHKPVEYSGQKFTVYLPASDNTKDILTVYTQGKKEPSEEPAPDPEPEQEPVSEPEQDNNPTSEDEQKVPSRDKDSSHSPDTSELPETTPVKKEDGAEKNTSSVYEKTSWETENEKADDDPTLDEAEEVVTGEMEENEEEVTEEGSFKEEENDNTKDLGAVGDEEKIETSRAPDVIKTPKRK
jgi:hypothetical protein